MAHQYVITGLAPDEEYRLMVGVEYDLSLPDFEDSTRSFTEVEAKTLAKDAPTPDAAATPEASEPTAAPTAASTPAATAVVVAPGESGSGRSGVLVAALVVVSILAALAIAAAAVLFIRSRGKAHYKY
jgi:uncharacterized protein HemX